MTRSTLATVLALTATIGAMPVASAQEQTMPDVEFETTELAPGLYMIGTYMLRNTTGFSGSYFRSSYIIQQ